MIVSLRLQNFRSYKEASFEFEPKVNIIVGPNTSGKTNLLEAVLLVCQGKSYRASTEALIAETQPWARLEALTEESTPRVVKLERQEVGKLRRTFEIDSKPLSRLGFGRKIPVVLFEPNQLMQISSSPEKRRNFIDDLLEQISPVFAQNRRLYNRALAQRNALLKQEIVDSQKLFPWDVRLGELGGYIVAQRLGLLKRINQDISSVYSDLAGKQHKINLSYDSPVNTKSYANEMVSLLADSVQKDKLRGFTTTGPHRDDIEITINGVELQQGCSRGEVRTLLLALKIAEARLIEEQLEQRPVMLLDDVFGELDGKRRKALIGHFKNHQTFITTTDADVISKDYTRAANRIALG